MRGHDIVVVGASAGGVPAIKEILRGLPADFPAAVFVVMHVPPQLPSFLAQVLEKAGPLPVNAVHGPVTFRPGHVYVAPPDHHLIVEKTAARIVRGPRENWHRPSVDVLFRSAASALGPRVIGVVLTGFLDDGAAGLAAIHREGGLTIVQDPKDALFPDMPLNALEAVQVDYCVPLSQVASTIVTAVQRPRGARPGGEVSEEVAIETEIASEHMNGRDALEKVGAPSTFTCPECQGPLWELRDGELLRFRCQVGHALSADSMLNGQQDVVERALWVALGAIQSRVALWDRIAERMTSPHLQQLSKHYRAKKDEAQRDLEALRSILTRNGKARRTTGRPAGSPRPASAEAAGSAARRPRARRRRTRGRSPQR